MNYKNCAIFLNGDLPRTKVARNYIQKDTLIICADGGSNNISKYRITPNVIIGDMDSIKPSKLKEFRKKNLEIIKIDEQETTDFEKCLKYCLEHKINDIYVFGGSGPRADHTLNNYSIMKRYYKKLNARMIDDKFEISFINHNTKFNYTKGELVSLLALPKATKVKTKGLRYPLHYEDLEFGKREGTLNESTSTSVSVSFDRGSLLIFVKHFI
jgi:thiamine pyrophosphokinase